MPQTQALRLGVLILTSVALQWFSYDVLAAKVFPESQYLFRQHAVDGGRCAEVLSYNGIRPFECAAPNANSIIRCRPPSV